MTRPPRATPSGPPQSISTAPRLRSLAPSHSELSLPPEGNSGASAAPRATRANISDRPPLAKAARVWKAPQSPVDQPITRRGP